MRYYLKNISTPKNIVPEIATKNKPLIVPNVDFNNNKKKRKNTCHTIISGWRQKIPINYALS